MAILAYLGAPRSGKSYSVVENNIIPALKQGRHVVTNIPLEVELITSVFGGTVTQLQKDDVLDPDLPDRIPHGVVLVLDEIWRRWPSGQKVSNASLKDLELLKEHGHKVDSKGKTMQVVLVTQNAADLASWVRGLVKFSFVHEKLDAVGMDKRFSIKIYQGCPTGAKIPEKLKIREQLSSYKPDVYQFYKSATQSESVDLNVGDEQVMDRRANIWASGSMVAILTFVPLALIGGGLLGYNYVASKLPSEEVAKVEQSPKRLEAPALPPIPQPLASPAAAPQPQAAPQPDPLNAGPLPSPTWRIVGYIKRKDADAPETPQAWASERGYNVPPDETSGDSRRWKEDQAILRGMAGMRTVSLSSCKRFPNSVEYYCDLDGERVTPWTGQQGLSETIGAQPMQQAREAVRTEQSEARTESRPPTS